MAGPTNTINVINPSGQLVSFPKDQLPQASKYGYRPASPEEVAQHFEKLDYTSGMNPTLAALAGAARGASFGTSDIALTKSGLVDPSTLSKLESYNPEASMAGEGAAIAASLLIPVEGEAAAGASAARAGLRAATAPVRAVSRMGQAVTEGAMAMLPEGAGMAGRIAGAGLAHAAGAAAEGAVYGLGRGAAEYGMGDPTLTGEKLLQHVGLSALLAGGLGGAMGLTGAAGGEALGALKRAFPDVPSPADALRKNGFDPIPESGGVASRMGDAIDIGEKAPEARQTFFDGLRAKKSNAADIEAAGMMIDAPVTEAMLSDSEHIGRLEHMLTTSGTPVGIAREQIYNQGLNRVRQVVDESLGPETETSLAQLGRSLKQGISEQFEKIYAPIKDLYNKVQEQAPYIDLTTGSKGFFKKTLKDAIEENTFIKGTPNHDMVQTFSRGIDQIDNLQKLQAFRTAIRDATGPETRKAAQVLTDAVDDVEHHAIKAFAEHNLSAESQAQVTALLENMKQAKAGYRALREKMADFGETVFGRGKRIYGPQDFADKIDAMTPEAFAKKLFQKENSDFMGFMMKEFPEQMKSVLQYQKSSLRDAAIGGEGKLLDPRKVFKSIGKMEPEIRDMLFSPAEQSKLRAAETYLNAFPKNYNPSGTSTMEAYRRLFSIEGLINTGKDAAARKVIQYSAGELHALNRIEDASISTAKKITTGAKSIFKTLKAGEGRAAAFAGSQIAEKWLSHDKQAEMVAQLRDLQNNPEKFVDTLEQSTRGIYAAAPETSQALQAAAARAVTYLSKVAPQVKSAYPLGEDPIPSPLELNIFAQRMHVIENPLSVLHDLRAGTFTSAHLEALQMVYPKLYTEMQAKVMEAMVDAQSKKTTIPYRTKNMLSLFLNQDLDSSTTSQSMAANQAVVSRAAAQAQAPDQAMMNGPKVSQKGLEKVSRSTAMMTEMQKSSQRLES